MGSLSPIQAVLGLKLTRAWRNDHVVIRNCPGLCSQTSPRNSAPKLTSKALKLTTSPLQACGPSTGSQALLSMAWTRPNAERCGGKRGTDGGGGGITGFQRASQELQIGLTSPYVGLRLKGGSGFLERLSLRDLGLDSAEGIGSGAVMFGKTRPK